MDFGASHDAKEQIRQAIDIVDLASGYLALRRQGRLYVANCPWHDDTRPSLQINPDRQTFKCWVCDIGGDIFNFVMRLERLEFREALELLAERAGVALSPTSQPRTEPGTPGDKRTQLAAMQWACDEFRRLLGSSQEGERARAYLAERGISPESIERFSVGFSANQWEWLVGRSRNGPYSPLVLERVGVVGRRSEGNSFYDRFKGRVIFPIRDVRSRVIAFGGRILPEFADERAAKYVNSPETPLYSKSDQLYALDLARDAIQKSGQAVVMEGYTDVIMAHQHGVTNAVAVCGTALGERHLRLLRRFTDRVVLVLDGDEAGQRRSNEVLEMFVANQVDLRILTLPDGLDPCDFLRREGGEAFEQMLQGAVDALEHKFRHIQRRIGPNPSIHAAAEGVEELLATLAKTNLQVGGATSASLLREQQVVGRIAREFHLREDEVRDRLKALRQNRKSLIASPTSDLPAERVAAAPMPAVLSLWEREIFELVLSNPALLGPIVESIPLAAMASQPAHRLYARLRAWHKQGETVSFDRLLSACEDEAEQNLLIDLDTSSQEKHQSDASHRLADIIASYQKQQDQQAQRQRLSIMRDTSLDPAQKEELLSEYFNNLKRRQTGSLSTDG